jgi:hypothetical protein
MPKTATSSVPATVPIRSDVGVTIGKLARAAKVGVETVWYYQRRRLLAVPHTSDIQRLCQLSRRSRASRLEPPGVNSCPVGTLTNSQSR